MYHPQPERLLRKMGKHYDPFWMSTDFPPNFIEISRKRNYVDPYLKEDFKSLDLTSLVQKLGFQNKNATHRVQGTGSPKGVDPPSSNHTKRQSVTKTGFSQEEFESVLQSWLLDMSACPVYYKWVDKGRIFWPRYIRKGACSVEELENGYHNELNPSSSSSSSSSSSRNSCSWPPVLQCRPDSPKRVTYLRWTCTQLKPTKLFDRFRQSGRTEANSHRHEASNQDGLKSAVVSSSDVFNEELISDTKHSDLYEDIRKTQPEARVNLENMEEDDSISVYNNLENVHSRSRFRKLLNTKDGRTLESQHRTKRSKEEGDANRTEEWSRKKWKNKRRKSNVKCRWIRIHDVVTERCQCS